MRLRALAARISLCSAFLSFAGRLGGETVRQRFAFWGQETLRNGFGSGDPSPAFCVYSDFLLCNMACQ
jgi:hypothetical protein